MKHKVCSAIRKLQTIPVPGVSVEQFVDYMKEETRMPLARTRRMVLLALKTGVEHNILTVDKQGLYRLKHLPVPKTKQVQFSQNSRRVVEGRGGARKVSKSRRQRRGQSTYLRSGNKTRRSQHKRSVARGERKTRGNAKINKPGESHRAQGKRGISRNSRRGKQKKTLFKKGK